MKGAVRPTFTAVPAVLRGNDGRNIPAGRGCRRSTLCVVVVDQPPSRIYTAIRLLSDPGATSGSGLSGRPSTEQKGGTGLGRSAS